VVVIRLARFGSKKRPKYRITVADSRKFTKSGRFLEVIGSYNPTPRGQEPKLTLDVEKAQAWIKQGAQPTLRVQTLMKQLNKAQS
jgi:small subunit ribosomal protein S16